MLVLHEGELLTCLVPAVDFLDLNAYLFENKGVERISFKDKVVDAVEVFATGPEDDPQHEFLYVGLQTLMGMFAFFSVDHPGVPEVVVCGSSVIDALAEFSTAVADAEVVRRIDETDQDLSFMVPLPDEMVEGLELSPGADGMTVVPMCHMGFIVDYEHLKDQAAADPTGRKQAELDALVTAVREMLTGELEGEPFIPTA